MTEHNESSTFKKLSDFIQNPRNKGGMSMSHIYQPAMLIVCLRQGGSASVNEIAMELLSHDISQIEYYEEITKEMPGKVLSNDRNQITEKVQDGRRTSGYKIKGADDLTDEERAQLIELCREKIDQYVSSRGSSIWSHRTKSSGVISGRIRHEVLKRAKSRCELCGATPDFRALEIDHILPRNHGGSDDISNLQALCYKCNSGKRDLDDTDFRGIAGSYQHREKGCVFCDFQVGGDRKAIAENELCFAIRDKYPVTEHHTLVIPKRHVSNYSDLYQPEINAIHHLLLEIRGQITEVDPSVSGFNIGINEGENAGQTIFHCHLHLIPRRQGDVPNPRGGVRGVIPGKQDY